MKKLVSICVCVVCVTAAFSQSIGLKWLDPEVWYTDSLQKKVMAVEHATYPDASGLPYVLVPWHQASEVVVEGVSLTALTPQEVEIVESSGREIPEVVECRLMVRGERKVSSYGLLVFPLVRENGVVRKVTALTVKCDGMANKVLDAPSDGARYASSSVLNAGKWVKVRVDNTGVYKVSFSELQAMGVNPATVRVFGYGGNMLQENFTKPYIDDLPELSLYRGKDYILFYAMGPIRWDFNSAQRQFRHTTNIYSNYGYYFITSDEGEGKSIVNDANDQLVSSGDVSVFSDYLAYEKDIRSLINSGREFYGEEFGAKTDYEFTFSVPNVKPASAYFRLDVAAKSSNAVTSFNIRVNDAYVNALNVSSLSGSPYYEYAKSANGNFLFTPQATDQLKVRLTYSTSTAVAWLNYFEMNFKRGLAKVGSSPLAFRVIDYIGQNLNHTLRVAGAAQETEVWNITDPANVKRMSGTYANNEFAFVASTHALQEYVAVNPNSDAFGKVVVVGGIANQDLHALPQTDMVIISHADFLSEAERLAEFHRNNSNLLVQVVDAELVYNEFSSGNPDATAYRRLMKMFYDRAATQAQQPKYLLLFGNGSFDNRQIINVERSKKKLLTFQSYNSLYETQSYVTDDYFGFLDDNEGTDLPYDVMDIGVGRFPAYTAAHAKVAVDKSINYLTNKVKGSWKNQVVFVADDGDANLHVKDADSVANYTARLYPDVLVRKLYLDAYKQEVTASGETYPLAKNLFDNYVKNGSLMLNYMGHGGYTGWTNEGILTTADILSMYNERLPLWVTATCGFSRFDENEDSGGEQVFLNAKGGGIALYSTTRTVYAGPNYYLNREFVKNVMAKDTDGRPLHLGDIMRNAKNARIGDSNKMCFTLLGDPALLLTYPNSHKVITDSINGVSVNGESTDSIGALSEVRLSGHIVDMKGAFAEEFNGYVNISVFDKIERLTTLANDEPNPDKKVPYSFDDRPNAIFTGTAEVKDGKFSFLFMVPKDIRYNFGTGRIVYYAADDELNYEANGEFQNFIIGGENENAVLENEGPEVKMFLNTPTFVSGDKVNESPVFVAEIFDESGINTIGSGIGHDIVLKLDNDPSREIVLNSYFNAVMGTYKQGEVRYKLTDLPNGKHTLYFRVWDLQNNSSSSELNFVVEKGLNPNLFEMYAYPNPVVNEANFVYIHDRPDDTFDVVAQVYDLAGRLLWTSDKSVFTQSYKTEINWNLVDGSGAKIGPGIYLVRMKVTVSSGDMVSKTIKLIVKGA